MLVVLAIHKETRTVTALGPYRSEPTAQHIGDLCRDPFAAEFYAEDEYDIRITPMRAYGA